MTMREILFRGKHSHKSMWDYGDLYIDHDKVYIGMRETMHGVRVHGEVIPDTIGQYTGLTDKNGKKIFEGDILSIARRMDGMGTYYFPAIEYPVNVVVKWDMCSWMWETIAEDTRYISFPDAWCHYECEVIGNIHDNPELMEGERHG